MLAIVAPAGIAIVISVKNRFDARRAALRGAEREAAQGGLRGAAASSVVDADGHWKESAVRAAERVAGLEALLQARDFDFKFAHLRGHSTSLRTGDSHLLCRHAGPSLRGGFSPQTTAGRASSTTMLGLSAGGSAEAGGGADAEGGGLGAAQARPRPCPAAQPGPCS